jgi:zinc protease
MSVGTDDPQRRVAQVAAAVLGGSYSARINQEVRIKRGLSYGASAGLNLYPEGGVLLTSAQTNHRNVAEVEQVMRHEIVRLAHDAPTVAELSARQAGLVGSFARQLDTTAGLASLVIDWVERRRTLEGIRDVVPAVLAVSAEQVRDFAAQHWSASQLRTVIVGDLDAAGPTLSREGAWVGSARQLRLDTATLR